jgi:hypothetical protein
MALLKPAPRTAIVLALLWCCALICSAASDIYPVALALLFAAGFLELTFNAMGDASTASRDTARTLPEP